LKLKIALSAIIALCFAASIGAYATERKSNGKGNVSGMVQFFSQDILYLEKELAGLMSECGKELGR